MEEAKRRVRRRHGNDLKKAVLDECVAGVSVASVAMAHGINANLVHKWRRLAQGKLAAVAAVAAAAASPTPALTFIPLVIASPTAQPLAVETRELRIELRRGAINATVIWPISAAAECAGWLREVLR